MLALDQASGSAAGGTGGAAAAGRLIVGILRSLWLSGSMALRNSS